MQLRCVTLRHVTSTLSCFTLCSNIILTINVPVVYMGLVLSGFEGGLSITLGILGWGEGGKGLKMETFLGP